MEYSLRVSQRNYTESKSENVFQSYMDMAAIKNFPLPCNCSLLNERKKSKKDCNPVLHDMQ